MSDKPPERRTVTYRDFYSKDLSDTDREQWNLVSDDPDTLRMTIEWRGSAPPKGPWHPGQEPKTPKS